MNIPFDFQRSPYTGWTRAHWEHIFARVTYGYVRAAEKQGTMARALYPHDYRVMPDDVDALESFARIASAWGAWLSNPNNSATLEFDGHVLNLQEILTRALLEGTNNNNPRTYWGDMHAMDQRIVESADVALAIWFSRERVFNRMNESQRAQIMNWLAQADAQETWYDNWILFPVLPMAVRLQLGYDVDENLLDARLEQIEEFYRGDGWYIDGPYAEFELYNAWMFGWHFLLWAKIDGARRPEILQRVLKRAQAFLAGFEHFFGANGSYPAWGRSIVYRFSAVACFVTGYWHNIHPASPGATRRLLSGNLRYFYDHEFLDPRDHFIRQGYHGDFPPASEAYISPGSPCWACHAFAALAFDANDALWTNVEEPLPVERADFELTLPSPGFSVVGNRATGHVQLLNAGAGHLPENPRHNYVSKYGKLVYSTHFPFNVLPAPDSYAPDAMISLTHDDEKYAHRFMSRAHGVAPGFSWCEFVENVEDDWQIVRIAIVMWRDVQIRVTRVLTSHRVRVGEAPGALGCDGAAFVTRQSHVQDGWEYAEASDGRALAIKRLHGYDAQRASEPFRGHSNINLAYPYAEQPLVTETARRMGTRSFATAVLLRPSAFDPMREFEGIHVAAQNDGNFEIQLPNNERVFVSLANVLPRQIRVGEHEIFGDAIRYARTNAARVAGIGVTHIENVCELDAAGTFDIAHRKDNRASVITNAGIKLSAAWFCGRASRVEARILDGSWLDVTARAANNTLSKTLVREMMDCRERTLAEFQLWK
jgi:hypothetical protein